MTAKKIIETHNPTFVLLPWGESKETQQLLPTKLPEEYELYMFNNYKLTPNSFNLVM